MVPISQHLGVVSKNRDLVAKVQALTGIVMSMDAPLINNMTKKQIYEWAGGDDGVKGRVQNAEHFLRGPLWRGFKVLGPNLEQYSSEKKAVCNRVLAHVVLRPNDVKPVVWRIRLYPLLLNIFRNERCNSDKKMASVHGGT